MRQFLFILLSFILFTSLCVQAQGYIENKDSIPSITYKRLYKLDLFRSLQGTMSIALEQVIKNNWTYNLSFMGTYASTKGLAKPYLKAQEFTYEDFENKLYDLDNVELIGYGVNFQLRKYSGRKVNYFKGYYGGSELFFRQLRLQSSIYDNTDQTTKDISKTLFLGYLGYMIGYQKIIRNVVCIDAYLGGGFFYSQYQKENKPTRFRNNYQIDFSGFYFNSGLLIGITY